MLLKLPNKSNIISLALGTLLALGNAPWALWYLSIGSLIAWFWLILVKALPKNIFESTIFFYGFGLFYLFSFDFGLWSPFLVVTLGAWLDCSNCFNCVTKFFSINLGFFCLFRPLLSFKFRSCNKFKFSRIFPFIFFNRISLG